MTIINFVVLTSDSSANFLNKANSKQKKGKFYKFVQNQLVTI